jgi:hypothetical protein
MARADIIRPALAAAALLSLAACDKYVDRRDQITFGSGDAVAFNKAAQIIDPWPASSRTVTHGMRGEQAEAALAKLRKREAGEDSPAATGQPTLSQLSPAPGGQPK